MNTPDHEIETSSITTPCLVPSGHSHLSKEVLTMESLVSLSLSKDLSKPGFFTPDVPDEQVSLAWGKRVVDHQCQWTRNLGLQNFTSC